MPTTPRRYRYPASSDQLRVYEDLQDLATDIDTDGTDALAESQFYVVKSAQESLVSNATLRDDNELAITRAGRQLAR